MSMKAAGAVASWDVLPLSQRGLAFLLADYTNAETGLCCPGVDTLARRCAMTRRGIQKALDNLEAAGVIRRHFRYIEGRQTTTQYEVLAPLNGKKNSHRGAPEFAPEDEPEFAPEGEPEFTQNQEVVNQEVGTGKTRACAREATVIPAGVDGQAWDEFLQHRREIRKPLTALAAKKAANLLSEHSPAEQRQMVDDSIRNRWTGLFPPKNKRQTTTNYERFQRGEYML